MRITRWVAFTWGLDVIEFPTVRAPRSYRIEIAGEEDDEQLQGVITRSLELDPGWNASLNDVRGLIASSMARARARSSTRRLVLRDGPRIIGAVLLAPEPDASEHLVPGPCLLMEYRNRSLGTLLFSSALRELRAAGLSRASAITREGSFAARFLYPKFGGASSPIAPLLAA